MKIKVKSYDVKTSSIRHNKPSQSKNKVRKYNDQIKTRGVIKDNRKYENDTTLSEAEKIARRMALENLKRKSVFKTSNIQSKKQKNSLFGKNDDDDNWENDPFLLKAKEVGKLDEGLDESSADEDEDGTDARQRQTEKYFSTGSKKKTLEEIIRDSKIEKYERSKINEKDSETTVQLNEKFRDKIRFMLPKSGAIAKMKSTNDRFQQDTTNFGEIFQENFGKLVYSQRPAKADGKSIKTVAKTNKEEKETEKLVNMKIKRLRDHLVRDGIENEDEENGEFSNDEEEDDDSDSNEIDEDEDEVDLDDSESELCEEIDDEGEDEEEEQDEEDEEESEENDDSDSEEETSPVNEQDTIKNLKQLIVNFSKRKLEVGTDDQQKDDVRPPMLKKCRKNSDIDVSNKNLDTVPENEKKTQLECFRVLLKMPDLQKDALVVMAEEMSTVDVEEKDFAKKLVLASLFEHTLRSQSAQNCHFSPELIAMLRFLLEKATEKSSAWLSMKSPIVDLDKSQLLTVCCIDDSCIDRQRKIVSFVYHVVNLVMSIIDVNGTSLVNQRALFGPFVDIITRLPLNFYPVWLVERLTMVRESIKCMEKEPVPVLRMKKVFKIVQLLEPDLECKFDPQKNLVTSLKNKVKSEKRSLKKEMKIRNMERTRAEMINVKKQSDLRKKKTMEIINHMVQIS